MRDRFPSVARYVRELLYGPEPVGRAGAAVLERYSHGQLDGGRLDGLPHFGMKGEANMSYLGYVASPQQFRGAAQLGASTNLSVQQYPALPNAAEPEALPTWLEDWTHLEGITPA